MYNYTPLYPETPRQGNAPAENAQQSPDSTKDKAQTTVSCEPCLQLATACDAGWPRCGLCRRRTLLGQVVKCTYESSELAENSSLHVRIVTLLQKLPDGMAVQLLFRLRNTPDLESVLAPPDDSTDATPKPSDQPPGQAASTSAEPAPDFETVISHSIMYPRLQPIDLTPLNVTIDRLCPVRGYSNVPNAGDVEMSDRRSPETQVDSDHDMEEVPSLGPPAYLDPRLESLRIKRWTKVPITDDMAALLISLYLQTDNLLLGFLDADLFIEDLISFSMEGCSPFLVNAVLYLSCLKYSGFDNQMYSVSQAFCREAEVVWIVQTSVDSLPGLAALNVFSFSAFLDEKDKLGHQLLEAARHMGGRLNLFGIMPDSPKVASLKAMSPRQRRIASHVAWGTYIWLTIHVFFYHNKPSAYYPLLPIPRRKSQDPKGSLNAATLLKRALNLHSDTFQHVCELYAMAGEVAFTYFSSTDVPLQDRVDFGFAESRYCRLLDWTKRLNERAARTSQAPVDVLALHMWFHCLVLDIFRPFLDPAGPEHLAKVAGRNIPPQEICDLSVAHLKEIAINYRTQEKAHRISPVITASLMHIINATFENLKDNERRTYFLVCMQYWQKLYATYPIMGGIAKGFMVKAMQADVIMPEEASRLEMELRRRGRHHEMSHPSVVSQVIIDFDTALRSSDGARLVNIAPLFEEYVVRPEGAE
ncbi:hypothetical protein S40293_09554 [Stachybotrys chartarum IBT 40293]|nr:hypothetical protein S40293_09554 [Stachybotrys chartarum IBT 40293]